MLLSETLGLKENGCKASERSGRSRQAIQETLRPAPARRITLKDLAAGMKNGSASFQHGNTAWLREVVCACMLNLHIEWINISR